MNLPIKPIKLEVQHKHDSTARSYQACAHATD